MDHWAVPGGFKESVAMPNDCPRIREAFWNIDLITPIDYGTITLSESYGRSGQGLESCVPC